MFPVQNPSITQEYGRKDSMYRKGYHSGVDLASSGQSIFAAVSGQVIEARYAPGKGADPNGWGNYVIVRANGYDMLYAHMSSLAVKKGDNVQEGAVLGKIGSTGNSTGPHLHFEVWRGPWTSRNDINPLDFLQQFSGVSVAGPPASQSFKLPEIKNPVDMSQDELLKYAGIGILVVSALALVRD
jgi:murein DD-endopeptidase MepM/ murein hydrolase activator NlpD